MRTLAAGQDALALSRDLAEVKLLTIVTYSDRTVPTIADVFRFSDETVEYDGFTWSPMLADVSSVLETMAHIPSAQNGADGDTLTRKITFELVNGEHGGDRLINTLRASAGRIDSAKIEYSTVLIPAAEKALPGRRIIAGSGIDQVWFRGRVSRAPVTTDSKITMEAVTERIQMPWVYADSSYVSRRDVGNRLPEIYGSARMVEGVLIDVGFYTTLAAPIDDSEPAAITFTELVPDLVDGDAIIDGEVVTVDHSFGIPFLPARGLDGTLPAPHQAGAIIQSLTRDPVRIAVAGHPCRSVSAVYLRNAHNDQPWLVAPEHYTVDPAYSYGGGTVTVVSFALDDLKTVLLQASASALVSQQASYEETPTTTVTEVYTGATRSQIAGTGGDTDIDGSWNYSGVDTAEPYYQQPGWSTPRRLVCEFTTGDFSPNGSKVVSRWRMVLQTEVTKEQLFTLGTLRMRFLMWIKNLSAKLGAGDGTQIEAVLYRDHTEDFHVGDTTPIAYSSWFIPDDETATLDDFADATTTAYLEVACRNSPQTDIDAKMIDGVWGVEVEYIDSGTTIPRLNDAAIQAAAMGHDLVVWADVDGHVAPNSNYEVASGELIEHPCDVLHHLISVRAGLLDSAVDYAGTFAMAANASHIGTAAAMGFDARLLGFTFEDIALRVAFEARLNLVPTEMGGGTLYVVRAPTSGDSWVTSGTQDEYPNVVDAESLEPGFTEVGRSRDDLASHFSAAYGYRSDIGSGEDAFVHLVTSVPTGAEAALGVVEHPRFYLLCYSDNASATEVQKVLDYFASEYSRDGGEVLVATVPHWIGYTLQMGDLVRFAQPWRVSGSEYTRVIEFSQTDRDNVSLRCVEVD